MSNASRLITRHGILMGHGFSAGYSAGLEDAAKKLSAMSEASDMVGCEEAASIYKIAEEAIRSLTDDG